MSKIYKLVKQEIIHAMPSIVYFFIVFNILHFTLGLMLKPDDVRYTNYYGVILGAILIGKVVIIIDNTRFINMFPDKALIYNIIWKTSIYSVATILLQILEALITLWFIHKTVLVFQFLKPTLVSHQFWAVQILISLFFLIYVTATEFSKVLGSATVKKILFG